ncbi:MAG: RIP metalloprotease RseP [Desulfobulbaceae bacterium]|nr:RIP metalloprotease RseP [Desulfobulbaceae bacterium]
MLTSALSFIIVLGPLIFVHELGHFLLAKYFKIKVLKFSIGFGKPLYSKTVGDTEYVVAALPLGGYVKMYGEHEDEVVPPEQQHRSFSHKSVGERMAVVLAGPVFNILFAALIFFGFFYIKGLPENLDNTLVGYITAESPAEKGGFKLGDQILSIDGNITDSWSKIPELVQASKGNEMAVVVKRGEQELTLKVTPQFKRSTNLFGEEVGEPIYLVGIMKGEDLIYKDVGIIESGKAAVLTTWRWGHLIFQGIVKLVERVIPASQVGGLFTIAGQAGDSMERGMADLFYFMAILSVNLGILNLLPIPVLDGGHLVFFTIEGIFRKPLNDHIMAIAQRIGIALLGALMILAFYNDISRMVSQWIAP